MPRSFFELEQSSLTLFSSFCIANTFWNISYLFYSRFICFHCCPFVPQEHSKPRWERSASMHDANKVTQTHKWLQMKREGDKGNKGQGSLRGLWQPSCPIWNHLWFHSWGVMSCASGSGPQMDYSRSNHNIWIWDAFCASECSFLFATFNVCPSASVYHSYHQHSTSRCPFQSPSPKATSSPLHTHSNLRWKKWIFILSSVSAIIIALSLQWKENTCWNTAEVKLYFWN